jgi:hypothetical protein
MAEWLRGRSILWMGAVLGLALLLPNHYSPWPSFHQELGAALAFLPLLVWSCLQRQAVPALAYGAAAMSLVPLLQLAAGQLYFAGDAWMNFLYLLGFALAVHAGSCLITLRQGCADERLTRLTALWVGLVIAGLVSVAIAAHQWLELQRLALFVVDMPPYGRPFGNLAQPNQLATLLLLGIAGLMFLWESGKLRAATTVAGVVLLMFGLVMTGSRSVLLALAWLVPAYALLRKRCALRTPPGAFGFLVGLYFLLLVTWQPLNDALLLPDDAGTALDRASEAGIRKVFWASMLDAIGRAPWIGYGWGQIGAAQTLTALDYPPTHLFFDSSHNLLIDLALWSGVPVALLITAGLALWFGWQIRRCSSALNWVTLVAVGVVFSHAMVEYPLSSAYFLLPVGLWMGALSAVHPAALDRWADRWIAASRAGLPVAGVTALLLAVLVAVDYPPYEDDWRVMRYQEARIGDLTPTQAPQPVILTQLHELLTVARVQPQPGMSMHEIERVRKVSERYAFSSLMFRYALAQGLNGQMEGAHQTLAKLCQMHTPRTCKETRRQWAELAQNRFPQLAIMPSSRTTSH